MLAKPEETIPKPAKADNPSLEQILDASINGIIATDVAGRIIFINAQALEICRLSCDKVTGAAIPEIFPKSGPLAMECLESRKPLLGHHIVENGVHLILNISLIENEKKIRGAYCSLQEMQLLERAARKLESHKRLIEQLETIFKTSSDGIVVYDGKGNFIRMNKAAAKLNGWKLKDVRGKNVADLLDEGWFDRSVTLEVLKTRRQVSLLQYVTKTKRHLLITGTPAFDEDGSISMVILNDRDLTQLNALKGQLEEARLISEKYKDELSEMSLGDFQEQQIIAESNEMRQTLRVALKLAKLDASNILILGESGTGKGILAKFIHQNSRRQKKPFIQINCAALPENLLEAELFGYEKGAFTGAREEGKAGLFELAQEGTLFLDEIGDLPFSVQAKLLKYLDDSVIQRLGGTKPISINCAVIAATNQDLDTLAKREKFRLDLYYRLNSFIIKIPPLRNRPGDLLELVKHFLDKYNKEYGQARRLSPNALERLQNHSYPGNIRELKNVIKRAVALSDRDVLDAEFFSSLGVEEKDIQKPVRSAGKPNFPRDIKGQLVSLEKELLKEAFARFKTTRKVAEYLQTSQSSIMRKLKKHSLHLN